MASSSRVGARSAWTTCRAVLSPPRAKPSSLASSTLVATRSMASSAASAPARSAPPTKRTAIGSAPAPAPTRRTYTTGSGGDERGTGGYDLYGDLEEPDGQPRRGRREARQLMEEDDGGQFLPDEVVDDMLADEDMQLSPEAEQMLDEEMAGEAADETSYIDDFDFDSLYGGTPGGGSGGALESDGAHPDETAIPDGGLTLEQEDALFATGAIPPPVTGDRVTDDLAATAAGEELSVEPRRVHTPAGHKFDLPVLPLPPGSNLKYRYHPVLHQFTNLLMRDGKLSAAQRQVAYMLNSLRTSSTPTFSPKYPLLPGHPPAAHLPLNPVLYLTLAIDSVAPLIKIKRLKGMAGGGAALEIPTPLPVRMRRRLAMTWILDAVAKKLSRGSGKKQFASRLASEVVSVIEGSSGVWDKRDQIHKAGTAARANMFLPQYRNSIK